MRRRQEGDCNESQRGDWPGIVCVESRETVMKAKEETGLALCVCVC